MFRLPVDALVILRAKLLALKTTKVEMSAKVVSLVLVYREPSTVVVLDPAENPGLHQTIIL